MKKLITIVAVLLTLGFASMSMAAEKEDMINIHTIASMDGKIFYVQHTLNPLKAAASMGEMKEISLWSALEAEYMNEGDYIEIVLSITGRMVDYRALSEFAEKGNGFNTFLIDKVNDNVDSHAYNDLGFSGRAQWLAENSWDKTKDGASYAWTKTKDGTSYVWTKTKDGSSFVWEKTKDGTSYVWNGVENVFTADEAVAGETPADETKKAETKTETKDIIYQSVFGAPEPKDA